jgi:hypothetical protein
MGRRKKTMTLTLIHHSPGKKGKQEYREFRSMKEVENYLARNQDRLARKQK